MATTASLIVSVLLNIVLVFAFGVLATFCRNLLHDQNQIYLRLKSDIDNVLEFLAEDDDLEYYMESPRAAAFYSKVVKIRNGLEAHREMLGE